MNSAVVAKVRYPGQVSGNGGQGAGKRGSGGRGVSDVFWDRGAPGRSGPGPGLLPNDDNKLCTRIIMSSGVTIDQVYQEIKKSGRIW